MCMLPLPHAGAEEFQVNLRLRLSWNSSELVCSKGTAQRCVGPKRFLKKVRNSGLLACSTSMERIAYKAALQLAANLINGTPIAGFQGPVNADRDLIVAKYERVWGKVSCSLSVRITLAGTRPDGEPEFNPEVEINFPACYRSIDDMRAFMALVDAVTNLGGEVQAALNKYEIYMPVSP